MQTNGSEPFTAVCVVLSRIALIVAFFVLWSTCLGAQTSTLQPFPVPTDFRPIESGRKIAALKQRLESGDSRALDEFWREAARIGTPLVEQAEDNSHQVIVTFIWRGNSGTHNVGLLAPLSHSPGMPKFPLTRLVDTDVWYKTWQMRDDLHFTYRFVPEVKSNDALLEQDATVDPLNPLKMNVSYDDGATTNEFSIAAMPRGQESPWIVKQLEIPAGKVERHQFKSSVLGNERGISVYTPPGYSRSVQGGYWLLVLFDGFHYDHSIPTTTILDNLIHAGKVPPFVAVMIDNPRESRYSELAYNSAFVDFVGTEVLPWIREHWNVTSDPQRSIVGGLSLGGSAASFVALRRPNLFGNVLSQSGAFWCCNDRDNLKWEWLSTAYQTSPKLKLRFFIEAGLMEDISKDGPTLLTANRRFVEVLKSKGYPTAYEEVGGSHEPVHWRSTLPEALMFLAK